MLAASLAKIVGGNKHHVLPHFFLGPSDPTLLSFFLSFFISLSLASSGEGVQRRRRHDLAMPGGGKESHVAEVGGSGGEAAVWFHPGRDHDDETVAL